LIIDEIHPIGTFVFSAVDFGIDFSVPTVISFPVLLFQHFIVFVFVYFLVSICLFLCKTRHFIFGKKQKKTQVGKYSRCLHKCRWKPIALAVSS